ncbi:MAG: response regulator [Crocinitomix sp.]|nr:response regulator [Crocinitomix sp.]
MKDLSVLIIEDHPLITEAYELYTLDFDENAKIRMAADIKTAEHLINNYEFDLAFCDVQLGISNSENVQTGVELAELLKARNAGVKIIIGTSIDDMYLIMGIKERVDPDALLIKNDYRGRDLKAIITAIMNNEKFYSITVTKLITKRDQFTDQYMLELKHFNLLLCMKFGYSNIKLEHTFNISNKTVLNWKNKIADAFDVSIKDIVEEAQRLQYI